MDRKAWQFDFERGMAILCLLAASVLSGCGKQPTGIVSQNDAAENSATGTSATGTSATGTSATGTTDGQNGPKDVYFFPISITCPLVEAASTAKIADEDEVIGVEVQGRFRAYKLSAMSTPQTHVINDLIERIAVTVTYCDRNRCIRAFTKTEPTDQPLDVATLGHVGGAMRLRIEGALLPQDSDEVPVPRLEFEKTSWREWKAAHPETDIYTGSFMAGVESGD